MHGRANFHEFGGKRRQAAISRDYNNVPRRNLFVLRRKTVARQNLGNALDLDNMQRKILPVRLLQQGDYKIHQGLLVVFISEAAI